MQPWLQARSTQLYSTLARHASLPWLVLGIGLLAAAAVGYWSAGEVSRKARDEFHLRAHDSEARIESKLRAYSDVLFAVRALMDRGPDDIGRREFHRFVDVLAIPARYPGITNISYTYHVRHDGVARHEQRMRAESDGMLNGLPPFTVKPSGERPEYDVFSYVEPLHPNTVALGLDLSADPLKARAVHRARDSGTLTAMPGVRLLRDDLNNRTTILLRLAVYAGGGIPATLEGRRSAFAGVAGVALQLPKMVAAALEAQEHTQLRVIIEDSTAEPAPSGPSPATPRILFDSLSADGTGEGIVPNGLAPFATSSEILVGDRTWRLRIVPIVDPLSGHAERYLPEAAASAVLTITLLLFGLLRSLSSAEANSRALARSVRLLEVQKSRLAETQEISNIGGWELDTRDGSTMTWSNQLYRLLGRAAGEPAHPSADFFFGQVIHPDDSDAVRDALRRVLRGETPVSLQCRIRRADGSERVVSTISRAEATDDGTRSRIVGTVRDITEEFAAARRERAQLTFIQTMMDAIPTPVYQKDADGRFQLCNEAWCQFLGRAQNGIIGHTLAELRQGAVVEAVTELDRKLLTRPGTGTIDVSIENATGELRQLTLHKASYRSEDGNITGLVGAAFDITERTETEQRLETTIGKLDRHIKVTSLAAGLSEALHACMSMDEACELVGKYMPQLLPDSAGALYLTAAPRMPLTLAASWGASAEFQCTLAATDCIAVRRSHARAVHGVSQELSCRHFDGPAPADYACLPLSAQGELIGLLHIRYSALTAVNAQQLDTSWPTLTSVADQLTLAVSNLMMRESLREQALHDQLTGLFNRHYLVARFKQELQRAERDCIPLSVILIDVDHFKHFNDKFGHAAGDHVLRELALRVLKAGRPSDVACRYGGEEFVLFLADTPAEVAMQRAAELRLAVKSLRLEWEGQSLGPLTISIGVAAYPAHGDNTDDLLRAADQALYRAKELGRDRVMLALLPHAAVAAHA